MLAGFSLAVVVAVSIQSASAQNPLLPQPSVSIPMDQLGAVAGKQYQGDGLSVMTTPDGVRLRCAFQRLEGLATSEELWLGSTADNSAGERFRVMAVATGRTTDFDCGDIFARQRVSGFVNVTDNVARFFRRSKMARSPSPAFLPFTSTSL